MLELHVTLLDGEKVLIRPLKPEDAALYPDYLAEVTADDLRMRFFLPMREVRPELIDKLIHYDPEHAMAFIAIAEASGRMLGVVRLHDDPDGEGGEFAILVRSHLKGNGLGWLMMKQMIAFAQEKGLETVHGQVLEENTTMLQMCRELGFDIADDPEERGMKASRWSCTSCRRSPPTNRIYGSAHCATRPRARASTTPSARNANSVTICTASRVVPPDGADGPTSPSSTAPMTAGAATRAS